MLWFNFVFALLCVESVTAELDAEFLDLQWLAFKEKFDKTYKNLREEAFRKIVYLRNLQKITVWNQEYAQGLVSFALGENEYSDRTSREFEFLKGLVLPSAIIQRVLGYPPLQASPQVNCTIDLRGDPCLASIKNQGLCGAEQQCVDCTGQYGTRGCSGGSYEACLTYWQHNKVDRAADYPYVARSSTCRTIAERGVTYVSQYASLTPWDEGLMQDMVCDLREPMAVAIHATSTFNQYKTGVFADPLCDNYSHTGRTYVNHAVTIVGLGQTPEGVDYWLVRNSWGPSWGENGYIRIKKGENMCNIAIDPVVLKR